MRAHLDKAHCIARLYSLGATIQEVLLLIQSLKEQNYFEVDANILSSLLVNAGIPTHRALEILEKFGGPEDTYILSILDRDDISILLVSDDAYPSLLRQIANPPPILMVRWKLRTDISLLWVVGSRKYSSYGEDIIHAFTPVLIRAGFGIVSGGALGIDSLAHEQAIKDGGYTVAVIGTGIDSDYPSSNRRMYSRILDSGGAIVSMFPIGIPALPHHFPIRNEVIVGLSKGIFAVEAGESSGTLITTTLALEANREVFAPPADIGRRNSIGTNRLIRESLAKCVLGPEDILCEYGIFPTHQPRVSKVLKKSIEDIQSSLLGVGDSDRILSSITMDPKDHDGLIAELGIPSAELSRSLSFLELSGCIAREPSWKWRKTLSN